MKRSCPACGHPAVSVWKLLSLGGLRRAQCQKCGAKIGLSPMSSLALAAVGTWFPVAGALAGAAVAVKLQHGALFGAVAGLLLSGGIFAGLYFRGARLVVA